MVRLGLLALPLLAACTGTIESAALVGLDPKEAAAQQAWVERALPIFASKCLMCHDGSMPDIGYLAGMDDLARRETLVSYVPRIVNLDAPTSSRVVTKGDHTATGGGPALDAATEIPDILVWIRAEAIARPDTTPPLETAQIVPMVCPDSMPDTTMCPVNVADITPLGTAGSIEFVSRTIVPDGTYVLNLKAKSGADGLYFEHPLFESYPAGATMPTPDPTDRFFATTVNLGPNSETTFGIMSGETISGFVSTDPIAIRFDVVDKQRP